MCNRYPDILVKNVWITIGFTYYEQKYWLIRHESALCLSCTQSLSPHILILAFCAICKAPRPLDWTTGNTSLDSFIMESWSNANHGYDAYMQWIEYSQLSMIQEATLLQQRCTHIADWLEPITNQRIKVICRTIVDGRNSHSFDFYQVTYFL